MPGGHVAAAQILEVNIISANELAPVAKFMKTFVVAWVQLDRKVRTRVDSIGHTNPSWNEKLVFRIDYDSLLLNDAASLTVEIYSTSARGVDTLVGSVVVPITSLFPPASMASHSKMQFVTLQILRPSGRPQGVLNVGVSLLEGTRRSFDLSSVAQSDLLPDPKTHHSNNKNQVGRSSTAAPRNQLRHSKSERSMMSGAPAAAGEKKGSLCSDVGPSPSVVAAAIAMGLYPRGAPTATTMTMTEDDQRAARSSIVLNNWIEDDSVEGLKTKIERWRSEIHPIYERRQQQPVVNLNYGRSSHRRNNTEPAKRSEHRRAGSGGGLFSCFGTAYGCEFSISCGGGSRRNSKKFDNNGDKAHLSLSEFSYGDPYV